MGTLRHLVEANFDINGITGTTTSDPIDLASADMLSIQCVIDVNTPSAKTFDSEATASLSVNFADKASTTDGDFFTFKDTNIATWAIALDTTGAAAVTPTAAAWLAVAAGKKALVDVSSATNDEDIAPLVATALNLLTGFAALFTTTDPNDGTLTIASDAAGLTGAAARSNFDASGNGSLAVSLTAGRNSEVLEGAANAVTIPAHGYFTGLKGQLTTTGTLPAGVTTTTDYFIIVVDVDTVSFAATLVLALAGTAINLTDEGAGVHTFTATALAAAAVKLQKSNSSIDDVRNAVAVWDDVAVATAITVDVDLWFEVDRPKYRWARLHYTLTAGSMSTDNNVLVKGSAA